ncbi:MAG: hypothetical protein GC154_16270 [bacterium]|nr:hypothetical protein [bacterium]
MILLIDPVSNQFTVKAASAQLIQESSKKTAEKTSESRSTDSLVKKSDAVSISFNLQGDLSALQQSVAEVQSQVKGQLERYFGLTGQDPEQASEFDPPENASAKQLMDFFSPSNTASRIVSFATGFFDAYQKNHGDASSKENVDGFTNLVSKAIDEGFAQAKDILGDTSGQGEVAKNIERTYAQVKQRIEEFRREHYNQLGLEPDPRTDPAAVDGATTGTEGQDINPIG